MTEPTDADRQRAHDTAARLVANYYTERDGGNSDGCARRLVDSIAAAIAAARAEGFEAGLREPERRAREFLGDPAKGVSGHGK